MALATGHNPRMTRSTETDQAALPIFRLSVLVQLLAAGFFGLFPLLAPVPFAGLFGYEGDAPLAYRLFGASTTGYALAAAFALWRRPGWAELRIPLVATVTFNVSAFVASAVALISAGPGPAIANFGVPVVLPLIVLVASGTFTVVASYWLRRDQGPSVAGDSKLSTTALGIIGLATLSAAVFGLLPLVVPELFAKLFGLPGTDVYLYRLAGAATWGYATAGWLELRAGRLEPIRIQNLAAIAFNALGAVASFIALLHGYGGLLAPLIVIAAGFFTVTLTLIHLRVIR
jgi:hypothetical protein